MRILLQGSTGYVGSAVLERLAARGHEVVAVARSAAVAGLVRAEAADAVIHAAATDDWALDRRLVEEAAAALAERSPADGPPPVLVYTSGVWVLGSRDGDASTEGSPARPIAKVAGREEVEASVLDLAGVRGVVVRPGIVHGRGRGIPELLVNWAREDGVGRYVAAPDGGEVGWPMVHVDDLADLFVHAVEQAEVRGVVHGVAERRVPVTDLAAAAAVAAGVAEGARAWDFDEAAGQLGLPFAEALVLDQDVEAPRARALGWSPTRRGAVAELRASPFPLREGDAPLVVGPRPHAQVSQTAPVELQEELARRALALDGVFEAPSRVSVPGARAFVLDPALADGPAAAFQVATEFAHLHPSDDGSMHLTLPPPLAERLYAAGWGEPHPFSGTPLLFGPRDEAELETLSAALRASYAYARGWAATSAADASAYRAEEAS